MAILSKDEAQGILKKVLGFTTADECEATLTGTNGGNIRTARNTVSTAGAVDNISLAVEARFGKRSGIATCNQFDEGTLRRCVQRAEEIARLAPESPEYVPMLGAQQYLTAPSFAASTAGITPDYRAAQAGASMKLCDQKKLTSASFLEDEAGFVAKRNSKGLEAYQQVTNLDFSITVRTPDGQGSGLRGQQLHRHRQVRRGPPDADCRRQGCRFGRRQGHRARQVHRDSGAGRAGVEHRRFAAGRPDRGFRCAQRRRRPLLPQQKRRRQQKGRKALR
jgi:hypothetical protein